MATFLRSWGTRLAATAQAAEITAITPAAGAPAIVGTPTVTQPVGSIERKINIKALIILSVLSAVLLTVGGVLTLVGAYLPARLKALYLAGIVSLIVGGMFTLGTVFDCLNDYCKAKGICS